jgi:hypothetical protein
MSIEHPYKRIYREMVNKYPIEEYLDDSRYANNMNSYIHSFNIIEKDIKILFDYISPNNENKSTFSHRIYELFFRCCTEFENNAKAILSDNDYQKPRMNITDILK